MKPLRTSDIATAAGIHPNTVRKYAELGYLPRPPRGPNGYRLFTERDLDQARLVVTFLRFSWLGEAFKQQAVDTVMRAAAGDFAAARASAAALLAQVAEERKRAELAAELLVGWATSPAPGARAAEGMSIKEAAAYLHVTAHTLRNWDRNRLVAVPRHPASGYRTYGPAELRRLMVIRALRRARYNLMSILNMFRQLEADPGIDPRDAIDSLPPGEADIYHSTYRWLTKVKAFEGYAREAAEQLEAMEGISMKRGGIVADTAWAPRLTDQVQTIVQQQLTPGLALAVARDGEQVYFHGFGYRNAAEQLPVTPDTVFGVASVTKSVACLAIMQLADRGKLAVSDPVVKWLPEFRVPHPQWTGQITIHHLMTHSSGLPDLPCLFGAMAGSVLRDPDRHRLGLSLDPDKVPPVRTYADLLRVMAETEYQLLGAPGSCFNYSNEGYALLQGIIERAGGQDFLAYAQEQILDPIGMAHSTFRAEQLAGFPAVTELYATELKDGQTEVFHAPVWWDSAEIYTSGSLKASAGDLLRYLEVYRTGGLAGGVRILSAASVRQMMTPHVPRPTGPHYGYGLDVESSPHGFTIVHHWGSTKGVASHVGVIPERGLTAVTLSNLSGFGSKDVGLVALEAAAGLAPGSLFRN